MMLKVLLVQNVLLKNKHEASINLVYTAVSHSGWLYLGDLA